MIRRSGTWCLLEFHKQPGAQFLHAEHPLPDLDESVLRPALHPGHGPLSMLGGSWPIPEQLLQSIAATHLPTVRFDSSRYSYAIEFGFEGAPDDTACPLGHPRYDLDADHAHRPYELLIAEPREFALGAKWPYYYDPDIRAYRWICDVCATPHG